MRSVLFRLQGWVYALLVFAFLFGQQSNLPDKFQTLLITLKAHRGDVLFPEAYQQFREILKDIQSQQLTEGEIQAQLKSLSDWIDKAKKCEQFFAEALQIRDHALTTGAGEYSEENFQKAEQVLQQAAREFEEGNEKKAGEQTLQAIQYYRLAEAEAIQNNLLGEARILIQESKDLGAEKFSPNTYQLTIQLLNNVETLIESNHLENPKLYLEAERLSEEAQHLLYLVRTIRGFYKQKDALETYILELEDEVQKLGLELGYSAKFYDGILPVLKNIRESLLLLKKEHEDLISRNQQLEQENQTLRDELRKYQQRALVQQDFRNRIAKFKQTFEQLGVRIELESDRLDIRVKGFQFEPGRSEVLPAYDPLLKKIADLLIEFPRSDIVVRYIQKADGNRDYARNLAYKRAESVKTYLQSQMLLEEERIRSEGEVDSGKANRGDTFPFLEIIVYLQKETLE